MKLEGAVLIDIAALAAKLVAGKQKYASDKGRTFGKWTVIDPFVGRRPGSAGEEV